jgi:hypothetical protein
VAKGRFWVKMRNTQQQQVISASPRNRTSSSMNAMLDTAKREETGASHTEKKPPESGLSN